MLGKRLQSFSQFILERADWNIESYWSGKLRKIPGDEALIKAIKELDETLNDLEDNYWYNREGRNFHHDHYALDMKIHEWPDLERWAKIKGYTQEEIDEDDSLEDSMYRDWARFMETTFEDFTEHYSDSFSWLRTIGAGGKSGGWLLLAPDTTHNDIANHVEEALDDYLTELSDVIDDPDLLKILQNDEDADALAELGILDQDQVDAARNAVDKQEIALTTIYDEIKYLNSIEEDLELVNRDIDKFRESCEEDFYVWLQDQ